MKLHEMSYHNSNYDRKFNSDEFYDLLANKVSEQLNRPLQKNEQAQIKTFVRKIDPDLLKPMYRDKSIKIMIDILIKEFKTVTCKEEDKFNYRKLLTKTIGTTSETDTSHAIYDNPNYLLNKENKTEKKIIDNLIKSEETSKDSDEYKNLSNYKKQLQEKGYDRERVNDINKYLVNYNKQINENNVEGFANENNKYNDNINSYISNMLGLTSASDFAKVLNPKSTYRKSYVMLDSRYRTNPNTDSISDFKWHINSNLSNANNSGAYLNGKIRDIIGIRVYPFRIPYVSMGDNKYSRISLLITEFQSQAFIGFGNNNFHFILRSSIDNDFIDLETNKFNDGFFWFETPQTDITSVTINFGNPIDKITFDRDNDLCVIDHFVSAPATHITTGNPHNLSNGDLIYLSNFNVGVANTSLPNQQLADDILKSGINNNNGHSITVLTPTTFTIPFATNTIQNPIVNPPKTNVYYGAKRIFIPMELIYIKPNVTE
jgi:hypothetical protein